jgi:hypothetical protein
MGKTLQARLDPVRRRQQRANALAWAAWGLLASAVVFLLYAAGRWLAGWELSFAALAGIALAGPLLGYTAGLLWRRDFHAAAIAIDAHYRLKDRATTALAFFDKPADATVHRLALNDALEHLGDVNPREVVPLRTPRVLPYAVGALAVAGLLLIFTSHPKRVNASASQPLAVVVAQADRVTDELRSLEKFASEEKDPELEKLVEQLKQVAEEMKQPGLDLREALAKLSEMQSALQQQQAKLNVGETDAQLKAMGEALALADPLATAGKALSAGQLDKAADELQKLDAPQLDRQSEKAVKEKLDQLAKQMQEAGNGALSQAAGEISQGLGGNGNKFKQGTNRLSGEARKQSKRKKLSDLLMKQCQCLGECKGECECEGKSLAEGNKPGGKKWGLGASGNELGERTANLGAKQEQRLTGKQSDEGEVEVETTHSPEAKQQAQREYRESYDKYRKISEAVLESEPIPLGHRQTIRRYFESIRPQDGEIEQVDAAVSPTLD